MERHGRGVATSAGNRKEIDAVLVDGKRRKVRSAFRTKGEWGVEHLNSRTKLK